MAIHLLFPESGIRFLLNKEDAKRLIDQETKNKTHIEVFRNFDFRQDAIVIHNTRSHVCRYVIAFQSKDFCIIGDEYLGSIYPHIPVNAKSHKMIGDFNVDFELYRVYINAPQRYEE